VEGKAIIFSAPSGAGKTTIVRHLINQVNSLSFSISATTRSKRPGEEDGKDYYFLSVAEFQRRISENEFVEYEEVYKDLMYGTLKAEVDRIWKAEKHVIFDVDVVGGVNLKKYFGNRSRSVFVRPPNLEILKKRLIGRKSENDSSLKQRLDKAAQELEFEKYFDEVVVNDQLDLTLARAENLVREFIKADHN